MSKKNEDASHISDSTKVANNAVGLAASLGGLAAIRQILAELPADFPAAILVVQHLYPGSPSRMVDILSRHTSLVVEQASKQQLRAGNVYVAPPDAHLLVSPDGILSLSNSAKVNFVRPSADLLFESMANSFEERAVAVVLTGRGCDGARGVQQVRKMGGVVLAQNEATCKSFGMPSFAIDTGCVDLVLSLHQLAFAITTIITPPRFDIGN